MSKIICKKEEEDSMSKISSKKLGMISVFSFVALSVFVWMSGLAVASDTIKIGIIEPFSGPFEYAGRIQVAAARFAVMEQNEKGGLFGKKVEIVTADCELKPDVALRKAKKMVLENKVSAIFTETGTHIGIALYNFSKSYKTIIINDGCLSDSLHTGEFFSPYAFRLSANGYALCMGLAQFMAKQPYRKYYIVNQDYAFGHAMAKSFEKAFKKYLPGGEIVGKDFHPIANKDFGPYISKIKNSGADAVFSSNWGLDAILLVKQARSLGLESPFPFAMIFGLDPYVVNELGKAAVGIHNVFDYAMGVDTPENKDFIKRYHEKVGSKEKDHLLWWPETSVGRVANAYKMYFAAAEKAGSVEPDKLIPVLENFSYETTVGKWTMRACDHQVLGPVFAGKITAEPNPWYNGSIDPKINFPWLLGKNIFKSDAQSVAIPATADYNPRCK